MMNYTFQHTINERVNRYFNFIILIILFVYVSGIFTYGERFRFWEYPFSYLGMLRTPEGNSNILSFIIFAAGNIINSAISFKICIIYDIFIYRIFFGICGTGFLLLTLPCDVMNSVHSLGGALIFGSFWLFSMAEINIFFHSVKKRHEVIYFILLNITVLPYAYLYFVNSPYQTIAQKPALIGLVMTVKCLLTYNKSIQAKEDKDKKVLKYLK